MRIRPTILSLAALPLSLSACATTPDSQPPQERPVGAGGVCTTEGTDALVGQTATAELGAQIREMTGAGIFQWVPPDSAVTMDYRQDRVRVFYDRDMKITRISCG